MAKITLKKQLGRNDYEEIIIEENDNDAIRKIKLHNKEVNHKVYEEKKLFSKYSLEDLEMLTGHEIADPNSDPLEKEKEEWYMRREIIIEECKNKLPDALSVLTVRQKEVFILKARSNETYRSIALKFNVNPKTIEESYKSALKKLRKFYRQFEDYEEFFPNLFKD